MAGDTLKFLDYRKPKLEAGDYTFEVTQTYGDPNGATITPLPQTVNIKVQGDRIRINPDQVFAKYPPAGEKGNFNDTIPHISLKSLLFLGSVPLITLIMMIFMVQKTLQRIMSHGFTSC